MKPKNDQSEKKNVSERLFVHPNNTRQPRDAQSLEDLHCSKHAIGDLTKGSWDLFVDAPSLMTFYSNNALHKKLGNRSNVPVRALAWAGFSNGDGQRVL